MAVLWIEGFEGFSGGATVGERTTNQTQINRKYDNFSAGDVGDNPRIVSGHDSARALNAGRSAEFGALEKSVAVASTYIVSLSLKYTTFPATRFLRFFDGTTEQASLQVTTDGRLRMNRGSGTLLEQTAASTLSTGTWYRIEINITIGNSGSWEVKLDGTTVLNGTGDTQAGSNAQMDGIQFLFQSTQEAGGEGITHMDNLVIQDNAGDFLGDGFFVDGILPNAVGDSSSFTPTSGDNYTNVDEVPADDDTTNVESSTDGHQDLYGYENVSISTGFAIEALQINTVVRDNGGGGEELITLIKSGTTTSGDTAQDPGTTYETLTRISEQNPDTSSAWVESTINSAQFGLEVNVP